MKKLFTFYCLPFTIRFQLPVYRLQKTVNRKHTENRKQPTENGFTLLEILLYLAIFGATIGSVIGLAQVSLGQRVKSQVISEVNYQADAALASISQAIKTASSVTSPALGTSSSSLTLAMPNPSLNPTVFESYDNGNTTRLRLSEGNPPTRYYLTNSHSVLANLNFSNYGLAGTKGSIQTRFDLSYKNDAGRDEYDFSKSFYGTANGR